MLVLFAELGKTSGLSGVGGRQGKKRGEWGRGEEGRQEEEGDKQRQTETAECHEMVAKLLPINPQ